MKWRFAFLLLILLLLLPLSNVATGQHLSTNTSISPESTLQQFPQIIKNSDQNYQLVGHIATPKPRRNALSNAAKPTTKQDISPSGISGKVMWISIGSAVLVGGVTAAVLLSGGDPTDSDTAPPPPDRPNN